MKLSVLLGSPPLRCSLSRVARASQRYTRGREYAILLVYSTRDHGGRLPAKARAAAERLRHARKCQVSSLESTHVEHSLRVLRHPEEAADSHVILIKHTRLDGTCHVSSVGRGWLGSGLMG